MSGFESLLDPCLESDPGLTHGPSLAHGPVELGRSEEEAIVESIARLGIMGSVVVLAAAFGGRAWGQEVPARAARSEPWEAGLATWKELAPWEALGARARAAETLARTRDVRALPLLERRYILARKPHRLLDRYLLSSSLAAHFAGAEEGREEVSRWLRKVKRKDPWFAYNAYLVIAGQGGTEEVARVALSTKGSTLLRAAAIEALGVRGDPRRSAEVLRELLGRRRISRDRLGRRLLTGACASATLNLHQRAPREVSAPLVESLIAVLERKKKSSRRVIALINAHLAKLFQVDPPQDPKASFWRAQAAAASTKEEAERSARAPEPPPQRRRRRPSWGSAPKASGSCT